MRVEELPEKGLLLHSTDSLRPNCSFIIALHSDNQQFKDTLYGILQKQLEFLEDIMFNTCN